MGTTLGARRSSRRRKEGRTACARLLLEHGAEAGLSVWAAARQGHFEVARLLIAHGADVDKPSNDGSTPVKAARGAGYDDVADLLIGAGARDGKLPFVTTMAQRVHIAVRVRKRDWRSTSPRPSKVRVRRV